METLLPYIAKVSLFWILLYGCYWLVLRRHTFFAWNRAYLVGSLLVAFALPQMPYPEGVPGLARYRIALPTWLSVNEAAPLAESETMDLSEAKFTAEIYGATPAYYALEVVATPWLDFTDWLTIIYCLGVAFMAARLFRQLRGVYAFFRKSPCLDMDAYRLYLLDDDSHGYRSGPFSFLNHIVTTRRDYELNFNTVLSHELAHVRQRHSWDILLVEGLRVVFWFNPVLVLYKKSLQQVHEYLADREVCAWEATPGAVAPGAVAPGAIAPGAIAPGAVAPRDRYAEFMISYASSAPNPDCRTARLVNPFFNTKLLKNRITMLYKNKNSNWSLGKYAAVALLVGFVSLLVASCGQNTDKQSETDETATVVEKDLLIEGTVVGTDGEPLPGAVVVVKGSQVGTTTTSQGQFSILVPADSELDFSFMNYKTASVQIEKQGTFNVTLAEKRADEASVALWMSPDTGRVEVVQRVKNQLLPNYVTDSVFTVVRTQPEFPGGIKALYRYIEDNINYPEPARRGKVSGKVFLTFVILADGTITQVKILKGMGFGTDEEAIRLVSTMPKWKPGAKDDGEKVNVRYNLPISFVLPEGKKEIGQVTPADKAPALATIEKRPIIIGDAGAFKGLTPQGKTTIEEDTNGTIKVKIRGWSSPLGTIPPLFIVDGVEQPATGPTFGNLQFSQSGVLSNINPNDIESISIVKDVSAKAKYGERGAYGVILVTTKQGKKKQPDLKK